MAYEQVSSLAAVPRQRPRPGTHLAWVGMALRAVEVGGSVLEGAAGSAARADPLAGVVVRIVVAYCKRGVVCGNPHLNGEVRFPLDGRQHDCPRCGGEITNARVELVPRRQAIDCLFAGGHEPNAENTGCLACGQTWREPSRTRNLESEPPE